MLRVDAHDVGAEAGPDRQERQPVRGGEQPPVQHALIELGELHDALGRDSFGRLVEAVNGIPVVLAGGSRLEDAELLRRMECAMQAGAIGCSVGRNIFMHRSPEAITRALSRVIRDRWPARKALAAMEEEVAVGAAR